MKVSPSPRNSFVLKVLLSAVALIGFGLGQTAIAQTASNLLTPPPGWISPLDQKQPCRPRTSTSLSISLIAMILTRHQT